VRVLGWTALFTAGLLLGTVISTPLQFAAAVLAIFAVAALVVYTPTEQRRSEEEYARQWREQRSHLSPKFSHRDDQFDVFADRKFN